MFTNFIKTAFRTLYRDWWYSLISIGGMAIGISVALLLSLFIKHELSFDRFHSDYHRIYRINTHIEQEGNDEKKYPMTIYDTGNALIEQIPDIEILTRLYFSSTGEVLINHEARVAKRLIYTDSTFFSLFNFKILNSESKNPLAEPNRIVITKEVSELWFGNDNPIGRTLQINTFDLDTIKNRFFKRYQTLTVSAVIENPPSNSHLRFSTLTNFNTMPSRMIRANGIDFITFVRLNRTSDSDLSSRIAQVNAIEIEKGFGRAHPKELTKTYLMQLADIHLHSNYQYEYGVIGSYTFVLVLIIVAVFVLSISSINFVNLATARADKRKREVGVRKAVGSSRGLVTIQFIGESVFSVLVALVIALMLLELLIHPFNNLLNTELTLQYKHNVVFFGVVLASVISVGVISGLYPALYISRFKPISILRGLWEKGNQNIFLKSSLIVLQFGIAVILIFSLQVINGQLRFIQKKDLGFDKQNVVLFFGLGERVVESFQVLSNDIRAIPGVISVSAAQSYPSSALSGMSLALEGSDPSKAFSIKEHRVQDYYLETLGMQIVNGRNFIPGSLSDDDGYLINEAAARILGVDNPIDAKVILWRRPGKIIGVVKDFHFESLRETVEPLVISRYNKRMSNLTIRIESSNKAKTIVDITETIKRVDSGYKPSYQFLDDILRKQYGSEERTFRLIFAASVIAIILSMIGLYALSAYAVTKRTKELGIRKILGASGTSLLGLLVGDTTKWVIIANIIALPISWYFAEAWLRDFAFRININPEFFIVTLLLTTAISFVTIGWQVYRATKSNPVDALRYE
jgi:putative ABC transport system permease protein